MPRLVTVKLQYPIYQKLLEMEKEVNQSIRKLFYTLQNDAEKAGAEKVIEYNTALIKENERKIADMPAKKAKFEQDFNEKYNHQMKVLMNRKNIVEAKLKHPQFLEKALYAWEMDKTWPALQKEEYELMLKSISFDIEELERKKQQILEEEKTGENYDIVKARLEDQNERLKKEIERFTRIIQLCNQLNIEVQPVKAASD